LPFTCPIPVSLSDTDTSQGLRRGVDKYAQMPLFDVYADPDEQDQVQRHRAILNRPNPEPAPRQVGEPPYTGNCQHCRSRGSNDVVSDCQGRLQIQTALLIEQINRNFN